MGDAVPRAQDALWHHGAFCALALPLRAQKGNWQREIGATMVRLEPGEGGQAPSGRFLRLTLMQICDAACRTKDAVVDLGESPAAWAAAMGLELDAADLRDLAVQVERLLSSRIAVSIGGPELSMLDARGRRRSDHREWQQRMRLNSRFLASLLDHMVPLDRDVVRRLSGTPEALDVYVWMAQGLHVRGGRAFIEGWADLQQRFGRGSPTPAAFRLGIEEAVRTVARADASLVATLDELDVRVRRENEPVATGNAAEAARPASDSPKAGDPAGPVPTGPVAAEATQVSFQEGPVQVTAPRLTPERADPTPPTSPPSSPPTAPMQDRVSLLRHLTGLPQVIWLRRGHGEENIVIGATPGPHFDADRLTVLAVEPMLLQVSGGLPEREFEMVSAWVMVNRDLIDDFWEGRISSFEELRDRVQQPRSPTWR